jgi:hypothetical protein
MPGKVTLEIVEGAMQGKKFAFEEHDTFLFGRHPDCHAALPEDTFISRHHFILEANPPNARIRDLGSLNGTYVNQKKCGGRKKEESPEEGARREHPQVDLDDEDRIQVGTTVFRVHMDWPMPPEWVCRCTECGEDVSREPGCASGGLYVCDACRAKAANDPYKLLRNMAQEVAGGKSRVTVPVIPGYDIGKKIGQGGMGAVYMARRVKDNTVVAVKVMLSKVAVDERARAAFFREMAILRALRHPNIVAFEDSGAAGSAFWFVMAYCNRGSAVDLLRRHKGKVPPEDAVPIFLHALGGLQFAHDKNFVHRDLKPHNLLLHEHEGRWEAKIGDFGLAKNFERAGFSGMTATGSYSGTFPFMAPEQVTGFKYMRPVTDVWSMAATFYYLLTGTTPRDHRPEEDPVNVVLMGRIIPIRERDPNIPARLAEVIDRALARDLDQRYASAREFRAALKRMLPGAKTEV